MKKEHLSQSLDLSMVPLNDTAILMDGKLLVMDNLDDSVAGVDADTVQDFNQHFPRKLSLSCLLIVVKGEMRFSVNLRDYVATAGMCVVVTEGSIIERVSVEGDMRCIVLSFMRNERPGFSSYHQYNVHRIYALQVALITLLPQHLEMLISSYRMLRSILTEPAYEYNRMDLASRCVDLMAGIVENGAADQAELTSKAARKDEIVARFLQCVQDNYREHRDLGFYAGELCLSLKYMSQVIYSQTGRHPSQWIKDYVILDAKTMLRSGMYTVQQVADELHFPNQSFFGKYFKEAVGVSPKKWK